ncbi:unnamed protein product [Choristocarpus tenellus]
MDIRYVASGTPQKEKTPERKISSLASLSQAIEGQMATVADTKTTMMMDLGGDEDQREQSIASVSEASQGRLASVRIRGQALNSMNLTAGDIIRSQRSKPRKTPDRSTPSSLPRLRTDRDTPMRPNQSVLIATPRSELSRSVDEGSATTADMEELIRRQKDQLKTKDFEIKRLLSEHYSKSEDLMKLKRSIDVSMHGDRETNNKIAELTDSLAKERSKLLSTEADLEVQNRKLIAMEQDVTNKAKKLSVMDEEQKRAHKENMELSTKLDEALQNVSRDPRLSPHALPQEDGMTGDSGSLVAVDELKCELSRTKEALAHLVREIEDIRLGRAKENQQHMEELERLKGMGSNKSGGWLLSFVKHLYYYLGWSGFLYFLYMLASGDALMPRGVDVYRYAH